MGLGSLLEQGIYDKREKSPQVRRLSLTLMFGSEGGLPSFTPGYCVTGAVAGGVVVCDAGGVAGAGVAGANVSGAGTIVLFCVIGGVTSGVLA